MVSINETSSSVVLSIETSQEIVNLLVNNQSLHQITPNPVKALLHLKHVDQSFIMILDATGRSIMRTKAMSAIDVSHLTPGVYYLQTSDTDIKRFLKY